MNCKGKFTETRGHTSLAALVHDASVMSVRLPLADWLLHRLVKDGKGRARPLTHFGALQTVSKENTKNGIAQELRATPKVRIQCLQSNRALYSPSALHRSTYTIKCNRHHFSPNITGHS
jgi:hypothetical protein